MKISVKIIALCLLFLTVDVLAHHSFVIYNGNQYKTFEGVLVRENFNAGSHAFFEFDVMDENGEVVTWKAETQATRLWPEDRPKFLDVADIGGEITVTGWPLRSGAPTLWVHSMKNESTGVGFSVDNRIVQGASQFTFGDGELLPEEAASLPEFDSEGRRTRTDDGLLTRFGARLMQQMSGKTFDERDDFE